MEKKLLFALDIGTRSVVGLIGEQTDSGIYVTAVERQEHKNRSMLDGQIHDVPEVAKVLASVTQRLVDQVGPLKKVSVAAAGRALCTLKAEVELDCSNRGTLTAEDERSLELAAIQAAQHQLATGSSIEDPTSYYCVGYSVVRFALDGIPLKTLVGQRGKNSSIELIATFLPRQVIDSLQAAIELVGLEIETLTLEPIAAISVLIPATMRHLNLTLVDVGAGTSDVAITRDGSVIGYGMVPHAGDEITEALSQEYLLDFKVAEHLKRQLGAISKRIPFTDILGTTSRLMPGEIIPRLLPAVTRLAQAIAQQILALNSVSPQAVLLVGGGSLTPQLPDELAKALDISPSRVGIRQPDTVDGIASIPQELQAPDGVTPLGILKLAGSRSLNFIHVRLNDQPLRLFNLGRLTVADALLVAGIDVRSLHGRPGMGIAITINNKKKFVPGSLGKSGNIHVNGKTASLADLLQEGDEITIAQGTDGEAPSLSLQEVMTLPPPLNITVNNQSFSIDPYMTVNEQRATGETRLADHDKIICRPPATIGEVLDWLGITTDPEEYGYLINGVERTFRYLPDYRLNGQKAVLSTPVHNNDAIFIPPHKLPTLGELLGIDETATECYTVTFNDTPCRIPTRRHSITIAGHAAKPSDIAQPNSSIDFSFYDVKPMVSDVLLAAAFDPRALPPASRIDVILNGQTAEYITPIKNGDMLAIKITEILAPGTSPVSTRNN
jgi:cell division ATPase FtsA